jgi:hypothetical protein
MKVSMTYIGLWWGFLAVLEQATVEKRKASTALGRAVGA